MLLYIISVRDNNNNNNNSNANNNNKYLFTSPVFFLFAAPSCALPSPFGNWLHHLAFYYYYLFKIFFLAIGPFLTSKVYRRDASIASCVAIVNTREHTCTVVLACIWRPSQSEDVKRVLGVTLTSFLFCFIFLSRRFFFFLLFFTWLPL
uniref:Uncharacterized protein n=1 Tax=Trypanosoma congolense (strain IL3000) TaxID=1068625 RepID=F9WE43_TRYCI|nr:hypothetical protein, unlikely [Trypanosoma congolense IL3000]